MATADLLSGLGKNGIENKKKKTVDFISY